MPQRAAGHRRNRLPRQRDSKKRPDVPEIKRPTDRSDRRIAMGLIAVAGLLAVVSSLPIA